MAIQQDVQEVSGWTCQTTTANAYGIAGLAYGSVLNITAQQQLDGSGANPAAGSVFDGGNAAHA